MLLTELGSLPLQIFWWQQTLEFYNKLAASPVDSLFHVILLDNLHDALQCGVHNFCSSIFQSLATVGHCMPRASDAVATGVELVAAGVDMVAVGVAFVAAVVAVGVELVGAAEALGVVTVATGIEVLLELVATGTAATVATGRELLLELVATGAAATGVALTVMAGDAGVVPPTTTVLGAAPVYQGAKPSPCRYSIFCHTMESQFGLVTRPPVSPEFAFQANQKKLVIGLCRASTGLPSAWTFSR